MGFVSSDLGVCQGTALPPGANPPFWDFDVQDTWKPRLRGECKCTYMSAKHVHRSLPAVVQSCMLLLICMFVQNETFWLKCLVLSY